MAFYNTGTAKTTAGSDKVTGAGTAWKIALVAGGMFSRAGMSVPIASVESDTDLTLAYEWPGATATSKYAIDLGRAEAASAIAANRRLAELVAGLDAMTAIGADLTNAADAQAALTALGLSTFVRGLMDEADGNAFLKAIAGDVLKLDQPAGSVQLFGKSGFGVTVHEDGAVSMPKRPLLIANRNAGQEVLAQGFNYGVLTDATGQVVINVGGWTFANPGNGFRGRAAYVPKAGYYRLTIRTYFYANMGGRRVTVSLNGAVTNTFCQATGNNEGSLMAQNIVALSKGDQLGLYLANADVTVYTGNGHTELAAEWIGELAA